MPPLDLIQSTATGSKIDFSLWERPRSGGSAGESGVEWSGAVWSGEWSKSLNRFFEAAPGPLGEIPTVLERKTARESESGPSSGRGRGRGVDSGPRVQNRGVSVRSEPKQIVMLCASSGPSWVDRVSLCLAFTELKNLVKWIRIAFARPYTTYTQP